MAETNQYIRIELQGRNYLLPSDASLAIEQRESLTANDDPESHVIAWRTMKSVRWPAYSLDGMLKPVRNAAWQRAVFLETSPYPVGVAADDVQLMTHLDSPIVRFTPLGPPPSRYGHLFSAAWVHEDGVILVIEPRALIGYLQSFQEE